MLKIDKLKKVDEIFGIKSWQTVSGALTEQQVSGSGEHESGFKQP